RVALTRTAGAPRGCSDTPSEVLALVGGPGPLRGVVLRPRRPAGMDAAGHPALATDGPGRPTVAGIPEVGPLADPAGERGDQRGLDRVRQLVDDAVDDGLDPGAEPAPRLVDRAAGPRQRPLLVRGRPVGHRMERRLPEGCARDVAGRRGL